MDFKQIKELIALCAEKKIFELEVQDGDVRLRVKCGERQPKMKITPMPTVLSGSAPTAETGDSTSAKTSAATALGDAASEEEDKLDSINSPMVGTFYQAPSPDSEPYVQVGDIVKPDTVLCIIEAMKLMNEIKAECSGRIARIVVENGQPVEYGQPLFLIESV